MGGNKCTNSVLTYTMQNGISFGVKESFIQMICLQRVTSFFFDNNLVFINQWKEPRLAKTRLWIEEGHSPIQT
jgi:hypothetical protein